MTLNKLFVLFLVFASGTARAEGVAIQFVDYFHSLLHGMGMPESAIKHWIAVPGGVLSLLIITLVGIKFKSHCEKSLKEGKPTDKVSVGNFVELIMEFIYGIGKDIIGEKQFKNHLWLLSGLFIFIFVSNLTGLVPGFHPTTLSLSTNMVMGGIVFLAYNYAGIKEHGFSYVKQFMGPILLLVPLFIFIELVAHAARPLSLSIRLYGNIFGDHLVLSVFTGLTYLFAPAAFLFFGLLVASIQSFVFTLLSSIYISLAISHDH